MKHVLRKYLSRRGSALFMVLSLMTALMVLVMAMYFSVVASRETQFKVFYQEQSYRSAVSISDAIITGLTNEAHLAAEGIWTPASGTESMLTTIQHMNVGDEISTNGNNFAAFLTSGGNADVDQLGAYSVTIKYLSDETMDGVPTRIYDIAITTSIGGVIDTAHSYMYVQEKIGEVPPCGSNLYASTGYVPNDVYLDGGAFYTNQFFDNEYAILGAYNEMQMKLYGDVSAGGSLTLNYIDGTSSEHTQTFAIRNMFTVNATTECNLGANGERGLVYVGGDYICNGKPVTGCDTYVLGDLHIKSNIGFASTDRLFVNGNIYIYNWATMPDTIYCTNVIDMAGYGRTNTSLGVDGKWHKATSEDDLPSGTLSVDEMIATLEGLTETRPYYNWVINSTDLEDDEGNARGDFISELDTRSDTSGERVTIRFNDGDAVGPEGTPAGTTTVTLPWVGLTKSGYFPRRDYIDDYDTSLNYTAVVIEDVINDRGGAIQSNDLTLIIDTGDDPRNQYLIKVQNNRCSKDAEGNVTHEWFSWYPGAENGAADGSVEMTIIIRGRGSVVIDVPDGVVYQDMDKQFIIHESWFCALGGTIGTNSVGDKLYDTSPLRAAANSVNTEALIHTKCEANCSHCNYQVDTDCGDCPAAECDGKIVEVTCPKHEYSYYFCDTCRTLGDPPQKDDDGDYYGLCVNRVDRVAWENKVNAMDHSSAEYQALVAEKDSDGWVYPTVNFFIVSVIESADIRLSTKLDGTTIIENALYGFIYAPYMTFKAYGANSGGDYVRFCGGLNVSDFVIKDSMAFLTCSPELLPMDLMSSDSYAVALEGKVEKTWKIGLAGY